MSGLHREPDGSPKPVHWLERLVEAVGRRVEKLIGRIWHRRRD